MQEEEYYALGIPGLDAALGGGVLRNAIILISFEPGSEEWAFGSEIIRNSLLRDEYVIHVDYDHSPDYYLNSFLGLNSEAAEVQDKLKQKYSSGRIKFIDCFTTEASQGKVKSESDDSILVDNPYNLSKLLFTMKQVRDSIPSGASVKWVFSNITSMSINLGIQDVIKFCRSAFRLHKQMNDQAIYYVNRGAHLTQFLSLIYQLVDVIVELKNKEVNNRMITFLRVVKNQFKDHISSDLGYKVDRGKVIISILK